MSDVVQEIMKPYQDLVYKCKMIDKTVPYDACYNPEYNMMEITKLNVDGEIVVSGNITRLVLNTNVISQLCGYNSTQVLILKKPEIIEGRNKIIFKPIIAGKLVFSETEYLIHFLKSKINFIIRLLNTSTSSNHIFEILTTLDNIISTYEKVLHEQSLDITKIELVSLYNGYLSGDSYKTINKRVGEIALKIREELEHLEHKMKQENNV